jgi:periplasmic glucans biosynthesis protein
MRSFDRRQLLRAAPPFALSLVTFGSRRGLAAAPAQRFGEPQPFSFDLLRQRAKESANRTYAATPPPAADLVQKIDFDAVQKIKFRADRGLWVDGSRPYPVRFFHLDKFNSLPVQINVVSGGMARRLVYSQDDFEYGDPDVPQKLPADLGYSGFRLMDGPEAKTDWLAFQGASYFRSAGQDNQYGGSARGIAVNTTASSKEEFPRFTEFWLQEPDSKSAAVTIYAFLDGQSLTGAYELVASKHTGAIMDIRASLFVRNDIAQLGIAPLTSMYWYGENEKEHASDWRPEIHDSDGLALSTGKGERIWRPLIDPPSLQTNSFIDDNPKAFGLMQRDRDFANYQDDGAFYNKRPSMWVEPQGTWGPGMVQLVEIPTEDEIHDNIVAYWKPKRDIKAGNQLDFAYRLYWQNDEPHPPDDIARITATRIGKGGIPGRPMPTDKDSWKFAIDFVGGPLARMAPRYDVTPVVSVSRGKILNPYVIKIVGTDRWRALFDIQAPGQEPVNLRCYLRLEDKALSETWLYQYFPPREPSRR